MKTPLWMALLLCCILPAPAIAQSDLDGMWRIDFSKSAFPTKPETFLLQNGTYQCKTCSPSIDVKADGEDHGVAGSPYFDTISVKVVNDRTIEVIKKKGGKTVGTSITTIFPDENSATFEFNDSSDTSAEAVTGKSTMTRVAKSKRPKAGSHAISGSWQISKVESLSENALIFTLKVDGESVTMSNPTGQSFTAKLDGTDAPYKGDVGIDTVSVLRMGPHTFTETDKRHGQVIRSERMMVTPGDARKMNIIVDNNLTGAATVLTAEKQ